MSTTVDLATIPFPEQAQDEIAALHQELNLSAVLERLKKGQAIPPEEYQSMLSTLADMFGSALPAIDADQPTATIKDSARDINVGRLLKSRGYFRLWRLLRHYVPYDATDPSTGEISSVDVPLWMTMLNPETNKPFPSREQVIIWFCQSASVSRANIFRTFAALDRLISLGVEEEEAYALLLTRPFVVQETLKDNMLGRWSKDKLVGMNQEVADRLLRLEGAGKAKIDRVRELIKVVNDPNTEQGEWESAREKLQTEMAPSITQAVREAVTVRVKDAMALVQADFRGLPEMIYKYDFDTDEILVELRYSDKDVNGTEYVSRIETIRYVPYPGEVGDHLRDDLLKRLPFVNKEKIDFTN